MPGKPGFNSQNFFLDASEVFLFCFVFKLGFIYLQNFDNHVIFLPMSVFEITDLITWATVFMFQSYTVPGTFLPLDMKEILLI